MGMGGMGAGRGGMGGRGGQWNWQWPGAAGAWAGPTFEAMMQGWMGEQPGQPGGAAPGAAGDHQEAHAQAQASASNAHASAHSAAHAAAQAAQAAEEAFATAGMPEGSGEEYLQRVGDFVAAALDPLGIDVQVDVETPGGQRNIFRELETLWLPPSTRLVSMCRWMWRPREDRGPLSSQVRLMRRRSR